MTKRNKILAAIAAFLVVIAVGGGALAGSVLATTQYGVRFYPLATIPTNLATATNIGLWSKNGDSNLYWHNSAGHDIQMTAGDITGAGNVLLSPASQQTGSVNVSSTIQGSTLGVIGTAMTGYLSTIDSGTGNNLGVTARQANTADGIGNASGDIAVGTLTLSAAGMKVFSLSTGGQQMNLGVFSGDVTFPGVYSRQMTVDAGGTTINKVVVFSGALKVQLPAATGNLKTVAGVALGTRTNGQSVNVMRVGPCLVVSDAGVAAGDLLVTSSAVAGNVMTNNSAGAGTIIGKAMEAVSNTVAGQVYVDLSIN
jgi:hypothetical protein